MLYYFQVTSFPGRLLRDRLGASHVFVPDDRIQDPHPGSANSSPSPLPYCIRLRAGPTVVQVIPIYKPSGLIEFQSILKTNPENTFNCGLIKVSGKD
ncbi:hypothetical protein DdX_12558 [Ditylenchus destructor]|uniref:Uncharacterized protein n=1 Tax=Ditylenchus destructor TaxID=166010 RepID=A0AAD4R0A7_9BILA|nr:hypothetical protein DdX_12558 [Ditylenchus destructor]